PNHANVLFGAGVVLSPYQQGQPIVPRRAHDVGGPFQFDPGPSVQHEPSPSASRSPPTLTNTTTSTAPPRSSRAPLVPSHRTIMAIEMLVPARDPFCKYFLGFLF